MIQRLVPTKWLKGSECFAFVPSSMQPVYDKRPNADVNKVVYTIDAFWTKRRNNGRIGLNFGKATLSFHGTQFLNMAYPDVIAALETEKNWPRNRFYAGSRILWDGRTIFMEELSQPVPNIADVVRDLVDAYPLLPQIPSGTDGWYKLG